MPGPFALKGSVHAAREYNSSNPEAGRFAFITSSVGCGLS
jgi:hypothetical protein